MIRIGNNDFILKEVKYTPHVRCLSLYDAYKKPSTRKIAIWNYWLNWFCDNRESEYDYIAIKSCNAQMFSINGQISHDGIAYTFLITPTKKEIYIL